MKNSLRMMGIAAVMWFGVAGTANAALEDLTTWTSWNGSSGSVSVAPNLAVLTADSGIFNTVYNITSFDWSFQANDYMPFNDFAYSLGSGFNILSDVATVGNFGNSGWQTFTFGTPYTGFLGFGVINVLDTSLSSQLSIKNVSAVPEPETYAMLLAGLGLLGFTARRRKTNAAMP